MRIDKKLQRDHVIPKDRICPHCGQRKLRSRQWICLTTFLGCRGCWMKAGKPQGPALASLPSTRKVARLIRLKAKAESPAALERKQRVWRCNYCRDVLPFNADYCSEGCRQDHALTKRRQNIFKNEF